MPNIFHLSIVRCLYSSIPNDCIKYSLITVKAFQPFQWLKKNWIYGKDGMCVVLLLASHLNIRLCW